jgi:hypothetical protein
MLPGALDAKKFNVHMRDSFLLWAIGRSRYVGMTNCFSAAREIHKLDDTSCTWTYHSPYGVACLPSESYCGKFLGPLATLAGASEPR